jgi:phospholipid-binding lipoprotein MlaA
MKLTIASVACIVQLAACATVPPGPKDPRDKFERTNRSVYKFNHGLDRAVLRPVTVAYVKVTPKPVRKGISNFLSNLTYPVTILNDYLQGKAKDGFSDIARFSVNTVVGIGGIFDPATRWGLEKHDKDFGQTLGKWGVPPGPFVMIPLLGPSTVRDAPAKIVDRFVSPGSYLTDAPEAIALAGGGVVNTRSDLLNTDRVIDTAYDPYAFVRNAWLQRRDFHVHDGQLPPEPEPAIDGSTSATGP